MWLVSWPTGQDNHYFNPLSNTKLSVSEPLNGTKWWSVIWFINNITGAWGPKSSEADIQEIFIWSLVHWISSFFTFVCCRIVYRLFCVTVQCVYNIGTLVWYILTEHRDSLHGNCLPCFQVLLLHLPLYNFYHFNFSCSFNYHMYIINWLTRN